MGTRNGTRHRHRLAAPPLSRINALNDDFAIADVDNGAALFNWANRLMLSLGQPVEPLAAAG